MFWDHLQMLFSILSEFERSNQLLFLLKSSENLWFSGDFRGNKTWLIRSNSRNIKIHIWKRSLPKNMFLLVEIVFMTTVRMTVSIIWDRVFKNGPSEVYGRQPLKKIKGCLLQVSLGPFLNTFSHIVY